MSTHGKVGKKIKEKKMSTYEMPRWFNLLRPCQIPNPSMLAFFHHQNNALATTSFLKKKRVKKENNGFVDDMYLFLLIMFSFSSFFLSYSRNIFSSSATPLGIFYFFLGAVFLKLLETSWSWRHWCTTPLTLVLDLFLLHIFFSLYFFSGSISSFMTGLLSLAILTLWLSTPRIFAWNLNSQPLVPQMRKSDWYLYLVWIMTGLNYVEIYDHVDIYFLFLKFLFYQLYHESTFHRSRVINLKEINV